jgi:FkbM family methyltransferase
MDVGAKYMSISTEVLTWLYKNANKSGLLDLSFARSLYISAYFTYKRYLEDPFARLTKYHPHLFKGGNIIDIGANIGYTSYVFSKVIEHSYKIFAFEPEKKNIEFLKKTSQKYNFLNHLELIAAAVGDHLGEIELWKNKTNNADHRILTQKLKNQLKGIIDTQKTPLITIDHYFKQFERPFPISFIKMDVQGYEQAVCNGMIDTLLQNSNVVIGFEYCPYVIESLGFQPKELLQFFQERHFNFYYLNKKNQIEPCDVLNNSAIEHQLYDKGYVDILSSKHKI